MSFGWLGQFRLGAWRELRDFVLNERRDLPAQLEYIRAELTKIGKITVLYNRSFDQATGDIRVTEERQGFTVTPGSSLEKLVQAYVALGGNPLNISQFFEPDRTVVTNTDNQGQVTTGEEHPFGGVVYPLSAEYNEPLNSSGEYPGGKVPLVKYPPNRVGSRKDTDADAEASVNWMSELRRPVEKEIDYKLHRLKYLVQKLMDAREQLFKRREELLAQSFGGVSNTAFGFDPERYSVNLRVPAIVNLYDRIFYEADSVTDVVDLNSVNTASLAQYENLFPDVLPREANTAI